MQRTACQEFAKEKDWQIVEEHYEKGVSGYKLSAEERDAIQDIKYSALNGNFDVLLVFMFDRIANERMKHLLWFNSSPKKALKSGAPKKANNASITM